jgi:hypothetical protein
MSFFLAEVSLLQIEKDGRFKKIITLILSGTCFEEEKETSDATEEETSSKKIEVVFNLHSHFQNEFVLLSNMKWISDHAIPPGEVNEIYTPPPES